MPGTPVGDRSDQHHFMETVLANGLVRRMLGAVSRPGNGPGGLSLFERLCEHYEDPTLHGFERVKWAVPTAGINLLIRATHANKKRLLSDVFRHRQRRRALMLTARSIARYGLSQPQRFVAPLMIVWNITDVCNLSCRHCYQDAGGGRKRGKELTRDERLAAVDQMADGALPILAIAGGEPLACPDLLPVVDRAVSRGIHVMIASNGTLVTEQAARRLKEAGVGYLEISIDHPDPAEHDRFRGHDGAWARAVAGILNGVRAGLYVGLATCLTARTADRLDDLVRLAEDLGCDVFSHFNFIPVGRGREMLEEDLPPETRERVLARLNDHLQRNRIKVLSTAPQLARACMMYGPPNGLFAQGHGGRAAGPEARILSKYVGGCGAGRCYCAIQPDGSVTPCVYMRPWPVGNLRERSLADIYDNDLFAALCDRSKFTGHCAVCDYRAYCGGCRARAAAYTGDPTAGDPGCVRNAALWEELKRNAEREMPAAGGTATGT